MNRPQEIRVHVPASSANLGPGFDAVAVALGLYLRCTLRPASGGKSTGLTIISSGTDADQIPRDASNLIWQTFTRLAGENAGKDFALEIANEIPLGRGLGSSAAAIVAGVALADTWNSTTGGKQRILQIATGLEGHPDNVAAATLGGLVVSCQTENGGVLTAQCPFPKDIELVLIVPHLQLSTEAARAVLPQEYTRRDAVFNVQRAAMFLAAIQTGRGDLLSEALRDRMHQPYRASLIPGFADALKLDNVPGLLGVALSGAGPSIIAFCKGDAATAGAAVAECFRRKGIAAEAKPLPIDTTGLVVEFVR